MTLDASGKEAALLQWRPFMHSEGDHLTLIHVYRAFLDRAWPGPGAGAWVWAWDPGPGPGPTAR